MDHRGRARATLQADEGVHQQVVKLWVIAFSVGETVKQLNHVSRVRGQHQIRADAFKGADSFSLCDHIQVAALGQEQRHLRERFQVTGFPGTNLPNSLGNDLEFALLKGIERQ